jgi:hypothetical protein
MLRDFSSDVRKIKDRLQCVPRSWDGKTSILELKNADFQWRQMEWWAFYFEFLCRKALSSDFSFPGDRFGSVSFDMRGACNFDLKAKAIKSDDHRCILNDVAATNRTIEKYGIHGVIIALCDVEYNDVNRTFQKWHDALKGGLSDYEEERRIRTSVSRYHATLTEILILKFDSHTIDRLSTWKQGRNSNGKPRPLKYMLDLEDSHEFVVQRIIF